MSERTDMDQLNQIYERKSELQEFFRVQTALRRAELCSTKAIVQHKTRMEHITKPKGMAAIFYKAGCACLSTASSTLI